MFIDTIENGVVVNIWPAKYGPLIKVAVPLNVYQEISWDANERPMLRLNISQTNV